MKILYLCTDFGIPVLGRKGASVHVRELIAAFGRAGHSVVLVAPKLNRIPWEEPAKLEGILLHIMPTQSSDDMLFSFKEFNEILGVENVLPGQIRRILYNHELTRRFRHRFKKNPPDLIYERASLYSISGVLLAQELNLPLIIELNAPLAVEQSIYRGAGFSELAAQAERWTLSRADAVLAVSAQLRDYAVSLGVESDRVHIIPNGVNATLFHPGRPAPDVRASWGLGAGPIVGFVGGLRPWHGVQVLPTLLDHLTKQYQNLQMVIAGEGPLRRELERNIKELKLTQHVVFTGSLPHEKVAGLIRQFDVALAPYPPLDHAFYFSPLKIFEYMACGIPVVAADIGQIGEVIKNGETGLLYPPGELDALIAACKRLLADTDLRQKLGQAAAEEVRNKYTWDHNASRVTKLAHSLIKALEANR
jgi:glycosyltransferase involved in cell wall biosynthesis